MYTKPTITKFGTFRELTRQGFSGAGDSISFGSANGSNCQGPGQGVTTTPGGTTLVCIIGSPASGQR